MDTKEFLMRIDEITNVTPGTLKGTETLSNVSGWDSLAKVEFQAFLDEEFHIEISPTRIAECKTVQDLMNLAGLPLSGE